MSDGLQKLKEIGAQTIHNETHISREYVQAIIHEHFEGLQNVQFVGFVSILEREYNVDLSDLKVKGRLHFAEEIEKQAEAKKVFVVAQRQKSSSGIYMGLGLIVVSAFLFYNFVYLNSTNPEIDTTYNENIEKTIEKVKVIEEKKLVEVENIVETNTSTIELKEESIEEVAEVSEAEPEVIEAEIVEVVNSLKILPKRKIWGGYINIKTNQKYQDVFRKEFALDITKDWLLLFGPGTVYLEVNGEKKKFASKQNMRFKYLNGTFKKINVTEFKSLNKGRKW